MNPLTSLPPQIRLYAYALLTLAALVVAGLKAADGDWLEFAGFVLGGLGFGTAASNVPSYRDVVTGEADPPPIDPDDRGAMDPAYALVVCILAIIAVVLFVTVLIPALR